MTERGSIEDIFREMAHPKYTFTEKKEIPKGSPTFQLIVTDCESERNDRKDREDDENDDIQRPSAEYMGRRRNTVGEAFDKNSRRKSVHFELSRSRKHSLMPGGGQFRSRSPSPSHGFLNNSTRSLSPLAQAAIRRNSIQQDLAFGSTKDRECLIHE